MMKIRNRASRNMPAGSAGGITIAGILVVTMAALLFSAPVSAGRSGAGTFPDIGNEPADIQSAIVYTTDNGYLYGAADGNFYPQEPTAKLDYARALVKLFGHDGEAADPNISFTDMSPSDPLFKYANLAVKYNYVGIKTDGSFGPNDAITTSDVLAGFARAMGFEPQVQLIEGLYPRGPAHRGTTIVCQDLHLRYRDTTSWPSHPYKRGELAFSLKAAEDVSSWREYYIRENFDWLHCQTPWVGPVRQAALDNAFAKVGYPYVWGGDCDAENGYDCSGLVFYVLYRALGYPMMRVADDQARDVRYPSVNRLELFPGDPVFFYENDSGNPATRINHAGLYIGQGLFIHSTGSNAGVSVDSLDGYWGNYFAWGKRVISEPEPETFDTYILLSNPGEEPAEAKLTYMLPDGRDFTRHVSLAPFSRQTEKVDRTLVNQEVSTSVEATEGSVIAERSMYFTYRSRYPGGHASPGVNDKSTTWYLPEGCTAWGFDTYILIQNPESSQADVTLTFMKSKGPPVEMKCAVAPHSRYTVSVDDVDEMAGAEFSTVVTSSSPVVVERSIYFDYYGIREGHNSPGVTGLGTDWYFAEGYTAGDFDSYILLLNPNDTDATVEMTLMSGKGKNREVDIKVAPLSRYTVSIDKIKDWDSAEVSVSLSSDTPIAAERSMYFNYNGLKGGHDALGSTAPSREWFLAEGYTAQDFDTYILMTNPGKEKADVAVRFMLNGGGFYDYQYSIPPLSRYTICVDKIPELAAAEVSARIQSSLPVVVERSIYFRYGAREGGTCAPGVTGTSGVWYFAEGYTGM